MKPTPKWIEALKWIKAREPVGWFDRTAPSKVLLKRLQTYRLIEQCDGRDRMGPFKLVSYRLTEAGLSLIAKDKQHD